MENGTKLRLLYIYQYLLHNTDAEHPISTPELMQYLKEAHGIDVNRTTLPNDFAMMDEAGFHCEVVRSRQNLYYFDDRTFDLAELRLLIDAVSSSRFIPPKKSEELIAKLESLASVHQAKKLRRHVTVAGRVKADNDKVLYIVDILNNAIDARRKVRFQMTDYGLRKRKTLHKDGQVYTVSPYTLVWDGDYYYLGGFCDNYGEIRHFRGDRILRVPEVLKNERAVPAPIDFNPAEYSHKVFRMFGGDREADVTLLCEANVMNGVIDQFGTQVKTEVVDEGHFRAYVHVTLSPTFYRWVFGWGGRMKIESPDDVLEAYRDMARKALA